MKILLLRFIPRWRNGTVARSGALGEEQDHDQQRHRDVLWDMAKGERMAEKIFDIHQSNYFRLWRRTLSSSMTGPTLLPGSELVWLWSPPSCSVWPRCASGLTRRRRTPWTCSTSCQSTTRNSKDTPMDPTDMPPTPDLTTAHSTDLTTTDPIKTTTLPTDLYNIAQIKKYTFFFHPPCHGSISPSSSDFIIVADQWHLCSHVSQWVCLKAVACQCTYAPHSPIVTSSK